MLESILVCEMILAFNVFPIFKYHGIETIFGIAIALMFLFYTKDESHKFKN